MNPFKEKINKAQQEQSENQYQVLLFSSQLAMAMSLTPQDVDTAFNTGVEWNIDGFTIYPAQRPWNHWFTHLEVRPNDLSKNLGYSNSSERPPDNWHFIPKGTATEILPDKETQEKILRLIRG